MLALLRAARWSLDRRPWKAAWALAAAVHIKLLPVVLLPGQARRAGVAAAVGLVFAVLAPFALFAAWGGPAVGGGLFTYAGTWEHNAFAFAGIRAVAERLDTAALLKPWIQTAQQWVGEGRVSWEFLYRHVWPRDIARLVAGGCVLMWVMWRLRHPVEVPRESLHVIGALLLLSPTLHPWYLLWILPFAVLYLTAGWLVLGLTVVLSYTSYAAGWPDVPWTVKLVEYGPPMALMLWGAFRSPTEGGGAVLALRR